MNRDLTLGKVEGCAVDDSGEFNELSAEQQRVLVEWIRDVMVPAEPDFPHSSYNMKHEFQFSPQGFYTTNGAFRGAMLAAGYLPVNEYEVNWLFPVKPAFRPREGRLAIRAKGKPCPDKRGGLSSEGWSTLSC